MSDLSWSWLYDLQKLSGGNNYRTEDLMNQIGSLKSELKGDLRNQYSKTKYYFKAGGDVVNKSDTKWLISGNTNSYERDFIWLPPNTNSDKLSKARTILHGDVDAIWIVDTPIKMCSTGEVVYEGVFKLADHRNVNITGDKMNGYKIKDYTTYFKPNKIPSDWHWSLPEKFK